METISVDYKRLAFNEYQDSKDKSRFTALAQKLAQHLNNLAQDKNSRIRWIWELIQNAKDVPNEFGRCKMRVEIRENKLIFAHNGDPFRVSDLESLVAQYSSKPEENKTHTETTGKYGTGFITTYILSRKVRIKGLLCMKTKEEMELVQKESVAQVQIGSEQEICIKKSRPLKQTSTLSEWTESEIGDRSGYLEDEILSEKSFSEAKGKKFEDGGLYQRFQIFLDRDYKDRDSELFHKLMKTERNLMEDLLKNQPKPKWQRTQNQLNTQFTYQQLDEAAFKMIEDSMSSLKQLFPYALLFNPKLAEIQMIDKRQGKKIKNFGIKRLDEGMYDGVRIFNASILEEGKQRRNISLAYLHDQETFSTVAVPVEFEENGIKLLEANGKFPKMFKQFPLIGCKDTGFNFVCTSKRFYPNESRSDLLLKQIEGRNCSKSKSNWESIEGIFRKGLQIYKRLTNMVREGQENLLIVTLKNQFTQPEFENNKMGLILQSFQKEMSGIKFISFKSQKRGNLSQLTFPCGQAGNKKCQAHQYSYLLNSVFSSVIGQNITLGDEWYRLWYPKLLTYRETWKNYVKYVTVEDCIKQLHMTTFQQLIYKAGGKELALQMLEKIYEFLHLYNPSYVTQDKPREGSDCSNFVLTNREEFKDLKSRVNEMTISVKENLPRAYQQIAEQIGLNINNFTIYDRFGKYFLKVRKFRVEEMLGLYESIFYVNSEKPSLSGSHESLVLLGRFLATFKIYSQATNIVVKLKNFDNVNVPLKVSDLHFNLQMNVHKRKQYKYLFELKVMRYIDDLIHSHDRLGTFMECTTFSSAEKNKGIEWLNSVYKLQSKLLKQTQVEQYKAVKKYCLKEESNRFMGGGLFGQNMSVKNNCLIHKNLSMSQKFIQNELLMCFCNDQDGQWVKGNYPDKNDIIFYEKMREIYNRKPQNSGNKLKQLKDQILHESINYKLPGGTTFKAMFKFTTQMYNNNINNYLTKQEKADILNYVYQLRKATQKNEDLQFKVQTFEEIQRKAYYEYPTFVKCVDTFEEQVYLFHLMKNNKELEAAMELSEKYGGLANAVKMLEQLGSKKNGDEKK